METEAAPWGGQRSTQTALRDGVGPPTRQMCCAVPASLSGSVVSCCVFVGGNTILSFAASSPVAAAASFLRRRLLIPSAPLSGRLPSPRWADERGVYKNKRRLGFNWQTSDCVAGGCTPQTSRTFEVRRWDSIRLDRLVQLRDRLHSHRMNEQARCLQL